jgi:glycosyltransferase involved in cell wall biosynthesis
VLTLDGLNGPSPRVLMFVPQYPYPVVGGLERQAHELSKALVSDFGMKVLVISGKIGPDQASCEYVEGVHVTRIPWLRNRVFRFVLTPFLLLVVLWRLRSRVDVVHVHQFSPASLYVIVISKLLGKAVLAKLPNSGRWGLPGLRMAPCGGVRTSLLLKSDGVVAMSQDSVAELLAEGFPRNRILSVPNGVAPLQTGTRKMEHCGSPRRPWRVVFVGRLSSEKRLNVLLNAWVDVHRRYAGTAVLELWGEGPQLRELREMSQALGLTQSVVFAGHVPDVRERLRYADIFVLPSAGEGNSNSVLEAMDAGLPIVATAVGGTPMQVGQQGAPLLFPDGDHKELAKRLILLLEDGELRREYGAAMTRRVAVHFDLRSVAQSYLCAYRILHSSKNPDLSGCARLPYTDIP